MSELVAGDERSDEPEKVEGWRLERFLALGYPVDVAESLVAAHADWHAIADLIAAGCPRELAARIVG